MRAGDLRMKGSFEISYERVHEVCQKYPDRFSGLAGVDPYRGMQGLRDLEQAVKEYGFVGAHLYPHWFDIAPDHAKYYPYYAKCCELDIPIMMQVGHNLIYQRDRRLPSVGRPICLDQVAIDFPELKLIGIHIGVPWTDEMISMAWKHENVFIGVDAYAPKHWPQQLVHYLNTYGRDKVLFGTDWPVIDPERAVAEIDALGPAAGVQSDADARQRAARLPPAGERKARSPRERNRPGSAWPETRSVRTPLDLSPGHARCRRSRRLQPHARQARAARRRAHADLPRSSFRASIASAPPRSAIWPAHSAIAPRSSPAIASNISRSCAASPGVGVAVATPSPRLTAAEVKLICDDCGARVLFVERALEDMVRAISFDTRRSASS